MGFDLGWLSARGSALKAAEERVALRPEIQNLSTQVESTRQHLTDLELKLAQARHYDAELASTTLNLTDLNPNELVFGELAS
ncbi:hypothetical protein RHMOL_Rhmol01G0158900 [Rhododendron molle]|uniref:Uncharacterized protein n=1 Tax=Rhododendron molle TaxID=49168 RepID=A0ACC0Q3T9_RHOML|nr:hypothetical protein RHMOL_Rhmol01G0158900 [Rhododendron molle]